MKKRLGLIGSIVLGAAIVTVGLSGEFALAKQNGENGKQGKQDQQGQNGQQDQNGPNRGHSVPEPSSLIFLGAGLAGLGIWAWRRKSTKV